MYEIEMCENVSTRLWTLVLRIQGLGGYWLWLCGWCNVVMIMGGRIDHPCWVNVMCRMSCFPSSLVVAAWGNRSLEEEEEEELQPWGIDHYNM